MNEESKVTREDIMEQLQAGHRARLDGGFLQNFNKDSVQFREVLPNRPQQQPQPPQPPQQNMPESYLNYAAQLLEQMRGVYGSSWDNCGCSSTWHGGHNHFYDPCSGADAAPASCGCPVYDCNSNVCCNDNFCKPACPPPQPACCPTPKPDCGCGTTTYYDDWGFKLQQLCDQMNRIESMTKEIYMTNQQLFSYIIEYYNNFIASNNTSKASNSNDC